VTVLLSNCPENRNVKKTGKRNANFIWFLSAKPGLDGGILTYKTTGTIA